MMRPGGTGRPIPDVPARSAPLPHGRPRIPARPSSRPVPKLWTHHVMTRPSLPVAVGPARPGGRFGRLLGPHDRPRATRPGKMRTRRPGPPPQPNLPDIRRAIVGRLFAHLMPYTSDAHAAATRFRPPHDVMSAHITLIPVTFAFCRERRHVHPYRHPTRDRPAEQHDAGNRSAHRNGSRVRSARLPQDP